MFEFKKTIFSETYKELILYKRINNFVFDKSDKFNLILSV